MATTKVLTKLRQFMKDANLFGGAAIQAYIIPSSDAHGSEYLCPKDKRRQFISGFTGSAGTAVVTFNNALLWTDGRYFLQASQQLDSNWTLMKDGLEGTPNIGAWLVNNLPPSSAIGIDFTLYEEDIFQNLQNELRKTNLTLHHNKENLVDLVWDDEKPKLSLTPLINVDLKYSGKKTSEKLKEIRETMNTKKIYAIAVTSLDEIAWLLNLRGSDVPYNMVFLAYCIITHRSCKLFLHLSRLNDDVKKYLLNEESNLEFYEYDEFYTEIDKFYKNEIISKSSETNGVNKIWICSRSNHALFSKFDSKYVHSELSLINKMKIIKNKCEIEASKRVHIKDSSAICEFFCLIEEKISKKQELDDDFNEFNLAKYIDNLRAKVNGFIKPSFETICGTGSNGAIIHYKPEENKSKKIELNNFLLLDSGGHYIDAGTTDVTRTVFLGDTSLISDNQKECFTRVLKGHIQLATRTFPSNTRAELIDAFARQSLWELGLDYGHGTGHGVGHLLNVHELPIMSNRRYTDIGLQENMIVTIEPGYYENEKFGIRIENCELVVDAKTPYKLKKFVTFESLTYVPIQVESIKTSLLTVDEIKWINSYHEKCLEYVGSYLKEINNQKVYDWLVEKTKPMKL